MTRAANKEYQHTVIEFFGKEIRVLSKLGTFQSMKSTFPIIDQ